MRRSSNAAVVLGLWLFAARALGQEAPAASAEQQALALAQQGLAARREGRDEDALRAFEQSLAVLERASVRAQLGFAQQALGRWVDAERTLAAVALVSDPWIDRHRATIDEALVTVRTHLGWLSVQVAPQRCEARADGAVLNTDTPIRFPIGSVTVTARCEGHFSVERMVSIRPGETARESITLQRRPAEVPIGPRVERRVVAPVVMREPPRVIERPRPRWLGPSITMGAGAVELALSGLFWGLRERSLGALRSAGCVEGSVEFVCDPALVSMETALSLHRDASTMSTASVVSVTAGAITLAVGAGWAIYEVLRSRGPRTDNARVMIAPWGARWQF